MKSAYIAHEIDKGVIDIIKTLYNIEELRERYSLEYLDCFDYPVAINYNWLNPNIIDLYYAYTKLYSSFYIKKGFNDYDLMDLEEEIGIRCAKIHSKESLLEDIKQLINEGHMVLVPGNLKYLFYSSYYLKEDRGHMFIVKGYDDENELFYILDSIQEKGEEGIPSYTDFVMRFSDLSDIYNGYEVITEPYIYYFEDINSEQMYKERVEIFLEKLYRAIENEKYMEYELLTNKKHLDGKVKDDEYLMNIPRYKEMMMLHIIKIMEQYSYDVSKLKDITEQLKTAWIKNNTRLILKLLKNTNGQMKYTFTEETKMGEKLLLSEIKNCLEYLSTKESNDRTTKIESLYKKMGDLDVYFENNQDSIIAYDENEKKIIFDFNNGMIYNTWIDDGCPKVVFYKADKAVEKFYLQVKCSIEIDSNKEGHQEGVYVRTDSHSMYAFAIDYMKKLILDNVGASTLESYYYCGNKQEIILYYELDQNKLSYGIISEDATKQQMGVYELTSKVKDIGLYCKTWNQCKYLKVIFSEHKFEFV